MICSNHAIEAMLKKRSPGWPIGNQTFRSDGRGSDPETGRCFFAPNWKDQENDP
jgi:hypothetical protein